MYLEVTDYPFIDGASNKEGNLDVCQELKVEDFWMHLLAEGAQWGIKNIWDFTGEDTTGQEVIDATQYLAEEKWQHAKKEESIDDELVQMFNIHIETLKEFAKLMKEKQTNYDDE